MENEFLNLVSSPLMNLDHTYRYSGTKLVEPESLSQHIVDTIMLGIKVIDGVNNCLTTKSSVHFDPSIYVMKAVYHDMEEAITGDIPRPLKYYNEDTLSSMRNVADKVAIEFFNSQFGENYQVHYNEWADAKTGPEGLILKIVDTLVVANKVIKEVSFLHNFYMLRVAHEVSGYLVETYHYVEEQNQYPKEVLNYLLSVLDGAITSMKDITERNKDIMRSLNIYGQSMIGEKSNV